MAGTFGRCRLRMEIGRFRPTDQKVGGSNPSQRATQVQISRCGPDGQGGGLCLPWPPSARSRPCPGWVGRPSCAGCSGVGGTRCLSFYETLTLSASTSAKDIGRPRLRPFTRTVAVAVAGGAYRVRPSTTSSPRCSGRSCSTRPASTPRTIRADRGPPRSCSLIGGPNVPAQDSFPRRLAFTFGSRSVHL